MSDLGLGRACSDTLAIEPPNMCQFEFEHQIKERVEASVEQLLKKYHAV